MTKERSYVNDQIEYYRSLLPAEKYAHPGVYSITVNGEVVYVGKARDMSIRVATHMYLTYCLNHTTAGKKFKYGELLRALQAGYDINFDVLYTSPLSCEEEPQKIEDDIGPQEAKYINKYMPKLNKQIPYVDNYHKYVNKNYEKLAI